MKNVLLHMIIALLLMSCAEEKPELPYFEACASPESLKDIKYYVKNNNSNAIGLTIAASTNTNEKIIKELLKSKSISKQDELIALWDSLDNPNPDVFSVLLKATKEVNAKQSDTQKTILMEACEKKRVDIVKILIKNGAKVDIKDKDGNVALGYAFYDTLYGGEFNEELISVLNKAGAFKSPDLKMITIPGRNIEMLSTEVTQDMYTFCMLNPSQFIGDNLPVDRVSWFEAIIFCNMLSIANGFTRVYTINDSTGEVTQDTSADGFRLPTVEEWQYAAKGGRNYTYAGSNIINEVAWYYGNSDHKSHPVGQLKPNDFGLYDMSGNVLEWCWDVKSGNVIKSRHICGGSWFGGKESCEVNIGRFWNNEDNRDKEIGFRVVRNIK